MPEAGGSWRLQRSCGRRPHPPIPGQRVTADTAVKHGQATPHDLALVGPASRTFDNSAGCTKPRPHDSGLCEGPGRPFSSLKWAVDFTAHLWAVLWSGNHILMRFLMWAQEQAEKIRQIAGEPGVELRNYLLEAAHCGERRRAT